MSPLLMIMNLQILEALKPMPRFIENHYINKLERIKNRHYGKMDYESAIYIFFKKVSFELSILSKFFKEKKYENKNRIRKQQQF